MIKGLAEELFFSKEAADYLGISTQRLNALVKEGKIRPLKKNPSGTIFHIDELNKRKEEQQIFLKGTLGGENKMFKLDTKEKNEAVNYASLMNILNITEQRLDPLFSELSKAIDISIPLVEKSVIDQYSNYFNIDANTLKKSYDYAKQAFLSLREKDEIIKRGNQDYPPLLAKTEHAPRFLYIRGKKSLLYEKRTVALVGSRQASDSSRENTQQLANKLGENGIVIISGLAKGIDVSAHCEALKGGYNTIAVIGTNLNQYYPLENKETQIQIEEKGLVVSQFSPANQTQRWFFPLRNSVMSGLSLATIIMEAGETSGALKQADYALKQHRIVMIPEASLNNPSISWPAKYVEKGAVTFKTPRDVLRKLAESEIFKPTNSNEPQQTIDDLLSNIANESQSAQIKMVNHILFNGD